MVWNKTEQKTWDADKIWNLRLLILTFQAIKSDKLKAFKFSND